MGGRQHQGLPLRPLISRTVERTCNAKGEIERGKEDETTDANVYGKKGKGIGSSFLLVNFEINESGIDCLVGDQWSKWCTMIGI